MFGTYYFNHINLEPFNSRTHVNVKDKVYEVSKRLLKLLFDHSLGFNWTILLRPVQ